MKSRPLPYSYLASFKNILDHSALLSPTFVCRSIFRGFSTTPPSLDWLAPKKGYKQKAPKGRPRVRTGGSTRGTTVVWGDYGLRMRDHQRRISAAQLSIGADTIKNRLRGYKYRLFTRVSANIGVFQSGNEVRMGKGKGSFNHWATRVAVNQIIFELQGDMHEQVIRDAFRLAGNKLPGLYEFVKKGDPPIMGITKVTKGMTIEDLKRPRVKLPIDITASRLPATTPP